MYVILHRHLKRNFRLMAKFIISSSKKHHPDVEYSNYIIQFISISIKAYGDLYVS